MKSVTVTRPLFSLRTFVLVAALAVPMLLCGRTSFAFLPAPLSPTYLTACAPVHSDEIVGEECSDKSKPLYSITNAPVNAPVLNLSTLIGYVYTTQVSGTVPAYLTACAPVHSDEIVGEECSDKSKPLYSITNAPVLNLSTLVGYVYPSIPGSTGFSISPKYFIGSVIYVPPGQGPSTVTYGAGTVTGTTVSTTQSWSNNSSAGLSIGDSTITFGNIFGGSTSHSVDMQNTSAESATYKGAASNSINHDYDQVQIFLGVKVNASVDYLGNVTWVADFSQIASEGFAETGILFLSDA